MKILKSIIFISLFMAMYFIIQPVFKFKHGDGIEPLTEFYKLPQNSIDVAFFGSSHVFCDISPATIWKEKGIPSFVLGGSVQPLWNTYYYIKECLKYQKPKVIALEVCSAIYGFEYSDYSRIIKNNIGLKFSKDKIESVMASTGSKKLWAELIVFDGFITYHTRYKELAKRDFINPYNNGTVYLNGYYSNWNITKLETPNVTNVFEVKNIPDKQLNYLTKIIKLCKEEKVELLFFLTPYNISKDAQKIFNFAALIAHDNDIPFINYNLDYDKTGIDFLSDFADPSHMNFSGGRKISAEIANELSGRYDLKDRRLEAEYQTWNEWAAKAERWIDEQRPKDENT